MPFSSGIFSRLYNWVTESGTPPIEIAKLDTQEEDFKTAFNNCLLRDGTGVPTAAQVWAFPLTASSLTITSSTIPANGLYLPAANTIGLSSNTTLRWSVNSTGNHVLAAPSSGTTVTVSNAGGAEILKLTDGTTNGIFITAATRFQMGTSSAHSVDIITGNAQRVTTNSAGNVTIAPGVAITAGGSKVAGVSFTSTADFGVYTGSGAPSISAAKGSLYLRSDGSATNNRAYINTDGSTTWTALTTAA